jgi:hypothetical protein
MKQLGSELTYARPAQAPLVDACLPLFGLSHPYIRDLWEEIAGCCD